MKKLNINTMKIDLKYSENSYWPPLSKEDFENMCPDGYKLKEVNDYGNGVYDITIKKKNKKYTRKQLIDFANSILIFNRIDFEVKTNVDIEEWLNYKENYKK